MHPLSQDMPPPIGGAKAKRQDEAMEVLTGPGGTRRRTRIIATLGPASHEAHIIKDLIGAGADIMRLNMSHGDHPWHRGALHRVRAASVEAGRPIAVMADLCGPKIRVAALPGGELLLRPGDQVAVTPVGSCPRPASIPVTYSGIGRDVAAGAPILLDDGLLQLRVLRVSPDALECSVVRGGRLTSGKSVNVPGTELAISSLTAKDRDDAAFAVGLGVDLLALSFVRDAGDVEDLRQLVASLCPSARPAIVAKIETPQALDNIDEILVAADAIMVARGDLGVEIGCERVPAVQAHLVARARAIGKPVIVATQMLESMVHSAVPTRAEVADVAQAVSSGADATMLSGETASGAHPVQAVAAMATIAQQAEISCRPALRSTEPAPDPTRAFARLTGDMAGSVGAAAIVLFADDETVASVSSVVRQIPILVPRPGRRIALRLALCSGVIAISGPPAPATDPDTLAELTASGLGQSYCSGAPIVAVVQHGEPGSATLSLHLVNAGMKPGLTGLEGSGFPAALAS
jgi:pyruvate kinase